MFKRFTRCSQTRPDSFGPRVRSLEEVGVSTQSPLRCRQQLPRYAKMCQDDSRTPTNYHKLIMAKARVMPFWEETIAPALKSGKTVFVAAHGNSIRAILKFLEGISDDDITGLETSINFGRFSRTWEKSRHARCCQHGQHAVQDTVALVRLGNPHRKAADVQTG